MLSGLNLLQWRSLDPWDQGALIAEYYEHNLREGWAGEQEALKLEADRAKTDTH